MCKHLIELDKCIKKLFRGKRGLKIAMNGFIINERENYLDRDEKSLVVFING
jgi:hypothetical protein